MARSNKTKSKRAATTAALRALNAPKDPVESAADNAAAETKRFNDMPRILVVEGLSGATDVVRAAGARAFEIGTWDVKDADKVLAGSMGEFDGMLLTGGGDVDPRLYDEKPSKHVYGVNATRDLIEWALLDWANEKGIAVMGICRGSQIINVHAGGTLKQHINGHRGGAHPVRTAKGSALAKAFAKKPDDKVVSLHHQMVGRIAEGYKVTARAYDGTREGFESDDGRVIAVQFHPEMDEWSEYSRAIFDTFVGAAARIAGKPAPKRDNDLLMSSYYRDYGTGWGATPRTTSYTNTPHTNVIGMLPAGSKKKSKHRKAGSRQFRGTVRATGDMTISWYCRKGCNARFDKEGDRDLHEEIVHSAPEVYECDYCGREFYGPQGLTALEEHQDECAVAPHYECMYCGHQCADTDDQWEHEHECQLRHHSGIESMSETELNELAARAAAFIEEEETESATA